ncbi:MAG TPA: hypothetical protein VK802_25480 [Streptosporangiaceae bacterium]|nr:hypothetical protein [Streptosporangiaceae bacterium]
MSLFVMVPVGVCRQIRDLVQQVVALGGVVKTIGAWVSYESVNAGAGKMGASFQQR